MVHENGKHGRPSPRTQGVTAEGETFQKFGTQQLEFVAPVVYGTPYQGVVQKDVGRTFKMFTTAPVQAVKGLLGLDTGTVFSQRILAGQTGATPVGAEYVPPPQKERCTLDDNKTACWITQAIGGEVCECPDWITGKVTDPTAGGRGCECEACKNGTGQCSATVPECDAWDLLCEGTGGASVGIVGGTDVWLWVKIILAVIGIGILLWLLRPLFGIAKNVTGITKSAVTRVNGMR